MRAASAFRKAGFEVRQSVHTLDTETGKARETDVIAFHPDILGITQITFVVECKASHKPWVLLSSHDTLAGYNRFFSFASTSSKAIEALFPKMIKDKEFPWFWKKGIIGYSFRQALLKAEDKDHAYSAACSVARACINLTNNRSGGHHPPFSFLFPVIVIDGPLFQCVLEEGGDLQTEEIEEGEFLFSTYLPEIFQTCIKVVTLRRLENFVIEAFDVGNRLRLLLQYEENEIRDSWKNG
jgi:hypothetical protein